jgi:hypothetical protein
MPAIGYINDWFQVSTHSPRGLFLWGYAV